MRDVVRVELTRSGLGFGLFAISVFGLLWLGLVGGQDRLLKLQELDEQKDRLNVAKQERQIKLGGLQNLQQQIGPVPAEVSPQQDPNAVLRAFWARLGFPPPSDLRLEQPEIALGFSRLSLLSFSARALVDDEQLRAFLAPLEAQHEQLILGELKLRPPQGQFVHPGQIEVQLRGQLLVRRAGAQQ